MIAPCSTPGNLALILCQWWMILLCTPGALDHAVPACQTALYKHQDLWHTCTWSHCWRPEFWLLQLSV
jgi:hypothetical protein